MSAWNDQMFEAKIVLRDGIVRRKKADVLHYASLADLLARVQLEQFNLVESGDQYIVICNQGAILLHC